MKQLIEQATEFLKGKIRNIPVKFSPELSKLLGQPVYLKLECTFGKMGISFSHLDSFMADLIHQWPPSTGEKFIQEQESFSNILFKCSPTQLAIS